ncbi:MAG: response regulator [Candidatus Xenobiia bacterium LiM19]
MKGNARSILIVEDESIVAKDLQNTLRLLGYLVHSVAFSAEDALEKIEKEHPDLIILDVVLRGPMNGIDAAQIIKTRFNIPILFSTAYPDKRLLNPTDFGEFCDLIIKPVDEKELQNKVEGILSRVENREPQQ